MQIDYYNPDSDYGIKWNDSDLNINWNVSRPILSEKDSSLPLLKSKNASSIINN